MLPINIMGEYALLSEVYGSDFKKDKKEKKEKKSKKKMPVIDVIEPDEMDKVLLDEQSVSPEVKVRNMNISPYEGTEARLLEDQNDMNNHNIQHNQHNQRRQDYSPKSVYQRQIGPIESLKDDPEYREFLEYKRKKRNQELIDEMEIIERKQKSRSSYSQKDQMNELLLYIFTGFFLLMLFDNIYKMGKRSY